MDAALCCHPVRRYAANCAKYHPRRRAVPRLRLRFDQGDVRFELRRVRCGLPTNRAFGAGDRDGIVFQKPKGMCFDGEAEIIFMRLNVACISLAECLILLAVGPTPLHAALRPSFNVDGCSCYATHIVLVQTTASEGVVSVVESWKGD